MKNINHQICCGCGGCAEVCPAGCITLGRDGRGFYKAFADESKCLDCGLCLKSCTMNPRQEEKKPLAAYAAYARDGALRQASSSGGIFTALARAVLKEGGAVFGAAFDEAMHLRHVSAAAEEELGALRGSKYLQSDMRGVFPKVKALLDGGVTVLFVGTPCQVAGLYAAVGRRENLLTCDLVCHGAPSPGLFRGYREYLEKKYKNTIIGWDFRSKDHANARMSYTVKLILEGEKSPRYISGDEEPYTMRFISGALQADACTGCPYTTLDRVGDVTLADYWGYEIAHPELEAVRGVSLVLVNTPAGERLLARGEGLEKIPTEEEKFRQQNNHLYRPVKSHPQRKSLYAAFAETGFTKAFYEKHFLPEGYRMYLLKRRIRSVLK